MTSPIVFPLEKSLWSNANQNLGLEACFFFPFILAPVLTFPVFFPHFRRHFKGLGENMSSESQQILFHLINTKL